jgi:hypothetical protein
LCWSPQVFNWLGAPPASKEEFAGLGLFAYGLSSPLLGFVLDASREVIPKDA